MCCIFKCVNLMLNMLLMIAFGIVAAFGAILKFSKETTESLLKSIFNIIDNEKAEKITDFIIENSGSISTILLTVGIFAGIFALVGVISACCAIRILMKIHIGILGGLIIIQLIATVVIFGSKTYFNDAVSIILNKTLEDYADSDSASSLVWNMIMEGGNQCCGFNNYTDFKNGSAQLDPLPLTCCEIVILLKKVSSSEECTAQKAESSRIEGCEAKINAFVEAKRVLLLAAPIGMMALQIVVVVVGLFHLLEKRMCC